MPPHPYLPDRLELRPQLWPSLRLVFWLTFMVCLSAAIGLGERVHAAAEWALVLLVPTLVLVGAFLWATVGTVELDRRSIVLRTRAARHQIAWDEVTSVRLDRRGRAVVFEGGDRRLVAPGPAWWGSEAAGEGRAWIEAMAYQRGLDLEIDRWAPYRWCRNTRTRDDAHGRRP